MFSIGDQVYFVNCKGFTTEKLKTISKITPSTIILREEFKGKIKTTRVFETHVDAYEANQSLFTDLEKAREYADERKKLVDSGISPYSIGDTITWNNRKHVGKIIDITHNSYVVYTPNRLWSLDPFQLNIFKTD